MTDTLPSQYSDSTSSSLLERAKKCDPAAWDRMSALYGPLVYQWCRQAGLQACDAADVVQEVFRSVVTSLDRFRGNHPEDTFRGWLWTITRNKIRDHFRSLATRPNAPGGTSLQAQFRRLPELLSPDGEGTAIGPVQASLARRAAELMRTDFEPTTWKSFWLTAVEQQPAVAVAQELGISTAAVYMAKSRVLRRLRDELEGMDLFD